METVSTSSEVIVHLRHKTQLKWCNRGARPWFARQGLDWNVFRTEGYPVSVLRATGDAFAARVCDLAEKEARGE